MTPSGVRTMRARSEGNRMKLLDEQWNIGHLRHHLRAAAGLEAWTIPYYMAAMFSIVDRASQEYQLIQTVVNQEMLHLQLVANVANAYGKPPVIGPDMFVYEGQIPHLDFDLDPDNPKQIFAPYSAEIGPLDGLRVNGMCLVEYPGWQTGGKPDFHDHVTEYGSIGEFYDAVQYGAGLLASEIVGGINQVDMFSAFYRNAPKLTVELSGADGFAQVELLIDVIRDQGEAAKAAQAIALPFQNTADDSDPAASHYEKFSQIRELYFPLHPGPQRPSLPLTYSVKDPSQYTAQDTKRLDILVDNFEKLMSALTDLFAGRNPAGFGPLMVTIGGNILACWKSGVTPRFTRPR
jgi:hypothetical protein